MGMPRALNEKYKEFKLQFFFDKGPFSFEERLFYVYKVGAMNMDLFDIYTKVELPPIIAILCGMKHRFKIDFIDDNHNPSSTGVDGLTRIEYEKYQGIKMSFGKYVAVTRKVTIATLIHSKLKEIDAQKLESDIKQAKVRDGALKFKNKIFASRAFPSKLKQLIFYRDNYQCQICGKGKEKLFSEGLHLEVDHVVEWSDGGETSYSNGRTICSDCNKGKYHAKSIIAFCNAA